MRNTFLQRVLPHVAAVLFLALLAMFFCQPALQGKLLTQTDNLHWKGMAQSSFEYRELHGNFPLWTNSQFCGMPAFQVAMEGAGWLSVHPLHEILMLGLPKPANFFFLLSIGFYFLAIVYGLRPVTGVLGATGYAYASYTAVIIFAGHDTKVLAMGYLPVLLAALVLVGRRQYLWGAMVGVLACGLLISMNHIQVTYYGVLMAGTWWLVYAITWIRAGRWKHLFISTAILGGTFVVGAATNALQLFTTWDYSRSTRKGVLQMGNATAKETKRSEGLDPEKTFYWSYGFLETYTFLVPDFYGRTSSGTLERDAPIVKFALKHRLAKESEIPALQADWPLYWGKQPGTQGTVYFGAICCFLFLLGLFQVRGPDRTWILLTIFLSLVLAWGSHLPGINYFIFDHLPGYNKFRAITMVLILPQLLIPLLGCIGLEQWLQQEAGSGRKRSPALTGASLVSVLLLAVACYLYAIFTYNAPGDPELLTGLTAGFTFDPVLSRELVELLRQQRQSMLGADLVRSGLLVLFAMTVCWAYQRRALRLNWVLVLLTAVSVADLVGVAVRALPWRLYLDPKTYAENNFALTAADREIKKDTGSYRVYSRVSWYDSRVSYYHHNAAGYSPARLSLMEDLLQYQQPNYRMDSAVMDMLNVRYLVVADSNGAQQAEHRNTALGDCWLVRGIYHAGGPAAAMRALNDVVLKDSAIVEDPAVLQPRFDSNASIKLLRNDNDSLLYAFSADSPQFAVCSEIFYDKGWHAYIDNREIPVFKTNYLLRGLELPSGRYTIRFLFHPASFYAGRTVERIANLVAVALLLGGLGYVLWQGRMGKTPLR
ncbi:YfhO family protein [Flavihumibacter petaseus]|uniref:Membrane protein YfhO n=1 Tax=Flavihumibacter petaseus NBRC 106054 TaxID=1220578 RepID=A0A0E9MZT5_9BACT|nr:YfhO family protein [Flavihumibacter petaseus]GAO43048.1 hypothetical protein FPE01S_02_01530 [Flavihumibacter petaseus NBRC 106054]